MLSHVERNRQQPEQRATDYKPVAATVQSFIH